MQTPQIRQLSAFLTGKPFVQGCRADILGALAKPFARGADNIIHGVRNLIPAFAAGFHNAPHGRFHARHEAGGSNDFAAGIKKRKLLCGLRHEFKSYPLHRIPRDSCWLRSNVVYTWRRLSGYSHLA
jgi:hypothetical protein